MNRPLPPSGTPTTTGRHLVLLRQNMLNEGIQALQETAGARNVVRMSEVIQSERAPEQLRQADTILFERLGVAVVNLDPERLSALSIAQESSSIQAIEPERIVYAMHHINGINHRGGPSLLEKQPPSQTRSTLTIDYLRGYRDAITTLVDPFLMPEEAMTPQAAAAAFDESRTTWGLQATNIVESPFTGKGIKVAILDTGLDLTHPDFKNRQITHKSFVEHSKIQDKAGHGTHCIGTSCGSVGGAIPLPRYGVASEAEIFAGKVLSDEGSGTDAQILAGIEWAIINGCKVVSMSFGARVSVGDPFSSVFEVVAQRALQQGTLLIAAAGNDSDRRVEFFSPVSHPANCPSIMAVAALSQDLQVAFFSNRGLNPDGGRVDIASPGVDVFSTWPMPRRYNTISGTSMATPHVAGIAALYAEATGFSGSALWNLLIQNARPLNEPVIDVGAGLVQAPTRPVATRTFIDTSVPVAVG